MQDNIHRAAKIRWSNGTHSVGVSAAGTSDAPRGVTVVTMVEPRMRERLDLATSRLFKTVHVESTDDAIAATRERSVRALLIAPRALADEHLPAGTRLVARCPGVTTVAVVAERNPNTNGRLLDLGACGVRHALDLSTREGWLELRTLAAQAGGETSVRILDVLNQVLIDATGMTRYFFHLLVRHAPTIQTSRACAKELRLDPSTFVSRFYRARLPSPKQYLAGTRLLYASAYLEVPGASLVDVANRLMYSSPQSFARHVQTVIGVTGGEFRREYTFAKMLERYLRDLIAPYRETYLQFDPFLRKEIVSRRHAVPGGSRQVH